MCGYCFKLKGEEVMTTECANRELVRAYAEILKNELLDGDHKPVVPSTLDCNNCNQKWLTVNFRSFGYSSNSPFTGDVIRFAETNGFSTEANAIRELPNYSTNPAYKGDCANCPSYYTPGSREELLVTENARLVTENARLVTEKIEFCNSVKKLHDTDALIQSQRSQINQSGLGSFFGSIISQMY